MIKKVLLKPRFKGLSLHSLYTEIINSPPPGFIIEYKKSNKKSSIYSVDNKSSNPIVKELIYNFKSIPYIITQKMQKNNFNDYDLVYASQHVLFNMVQPWITDLEFVNAFAAFGSVLIIKNIVQKQLETNQCKFILPWSKWSKETLIRSLDCTKFKEKIQVIRYTVSPKEFVKRSHGYVEFLFVGSSNPMNIQNIQFKNLKETIIAFNRISSKYDNIHLTLRTYLPQNLKKLTEKNPKISVKDSLLTKDDLYKLYMNADVFVLPAHETLGISLLDAMSFELPVIAMNIYDIPETISHMQNGILIEGHKDMQYYTKNLVPYDYSWGFKKNMKKYSEYIISQLERHFIELVENSSLRKKLGREARNTIENGELSIKKRNVKLLAVFEQATK